MCVALNREGWITRDPEAIVGVAAFAGHGFVNGVLDDRGQARDADLPKVETRR